MLWQWGNIFYWDIDNDSDSAGMLACSYIRISFKVTIAQICFHFSQRRMSSQVRGASMGSLRTLWVPIRSRKAHWTPPEFHCCQGLGKHRGAPGGVQWAFRDLMGTHRVRKLPMEAPRTWLDILLWLK